MKIGRSFTSTEKEISKTREKSATLIAMSRALISFLRYPLHTESVDTHTLYLKKSICLDITTER